MIYLDFDGVICDSAKEAFYISLVTSRKIENIHDKRFEYLYPRYLELRNKVTHAWTYYYVLESMFSETVKYEEWLFNSQVEEFERRFFETRQKIKDTQYDDWIKLHTFYEPVLQKLRGIRSAFIILTNKDAGAVSELCKLNDILPLEIISMASMDKSLKKIDIIKKRLPVNGSARFLDDNYETVVESKCLAAVQVNQAAWGYADKFDKDSMISLNQFNDWFGGNI